MRQRNGVGYELTVDPNSAEFIAAWAAEIIVIVGHETIQLRTRIAELEAELERLKTK